MAKVPAAGGDDAGRSRVDKIPQHVALELAERNLTLPREELGNARARLLLDERVQIEATKREALRDQTRERRLSGSHEANDEESPRVDCGHHQ